METGVEYFGREELFVDLYTFKMKPLHTIREGYAVLQEPAKSVDCACGIASIALYQ